MNDRIEEQEEELDRYGIKWARDCVDRYGFVYTLGLLQFLSVIVKDEMAADIMKNSDLGMKQ